MIHPATAAVVNAVWDLWAKLEGKPLWKLLVDLTPEEIVGCIDFRYITDALAPEEALELLRDARRGSAARESEIVAAGYPGVHDLGRLAGLRRRQGRVARSGGRRVGLHSREDEGRQRPRLRRPPGRSDPPRARPRGDPDDGRQPGVGRRRGDRGDAVLGAHDPWWIEEPTSPDDILGHARIRREIAPVRVATGEHIQNRVVFKQLFQAEAIDVCQLDACRVGGVNEAISIQLLAAKFGIPVCPHAGGVGLCEYVQHLAFFDYISVSGSLENRIVEWVDHLHEHFRDPAVVRDGRYVAPTAPGYSIEMLPESLDEYAFPDGPAWVDVALSVGED